MLPDSSKRLSYAKLSLNGLSIGDAIGESFFGKEEDVLLKIEKRIVEGGELLFTDDTIMGIGVFKTLEKFGEINQDYLATLFAINYHRDVNRGYGGTAHGILRNISEGKDWRIISANVFDGMGSKGNGAAMRAGIIGAYFFDDIEKVKEQAILSAEPTHAHIEAKAGAVAVAVAAALALQYKDIIIEPSVFIDKVLESVPDSETKSTLRKALQLPISYHINTVLAALGNGIKLMASDTVPFAIWCAAHHLKNYKEGIWKAISALGDRDTVCAIVGSILAVSCNRPIIPPEWISKTEDPEESIFWKEEETNSTELTN
jgi:ADP-ribosylglycohydrolase